MSSKIMQLIMVFTLSTFVSSSFAAWGYHKSYTVCRGGNCHHTNVNKGCVNGNCAVKRTGTTWHR
ncbi:hypothetical protein OQJ18_00380 [Fluoribacter dumoffii]|uniref:Uncharacterized protein n=1 Tax=Fluoribacter dumoffii TaxID=463 RepID=A0A377GC24_9GAMM|nr:hypothetical protein [Fluoribacter dumoffii]KTC90695.1 hypothetical protein Ldum_1763 [Fluoribacter dumoffii NY 23]MCW8386375.1 hypothetical protein [Fluoribacter dumoffii]MCW8419428.1 hypothetical protein [Fluoribacter dumoffii]MCW8452697.1 hypothetical protein [Fluoribacter dumoffii]MCW8460053.1 hypothetical protein [Fluoribacter dumoffii]